MDEDKKFFVLRIEDNEWVVYNVATNEAFVFLSKSAAEYYMDSCELIHGQ